MIYSDGSREEIENGIYQRKDTSSRTVAERRATEADRTRLDALISEAGADVERELVLADGTKVEVAPAKIEVTRPDGSSEEIENGVYGPKDSAGNTAEQVPQRRLTRPASKPTCPKILKRPPARPAAKTAARTARANPWF